MKRPLAWILIGTSVILLVGVVPPALSWVRVQQALRLLESEDPEVVAQGHRELVAEGGAALDLLLEELADPTQQQCEEISAVVREIDPGAAVDTLLKRLDSSDLEVRLRAIRTLGRLQDARACPALIALLDSREERVMNASATALAFIACDAARPEFRTRLVSGRASLRAMSAYGLGMLKDHESVPLLKRALSDHSEYVRTQAQRALKDLGAWNEELEAAERERRIP